MPSSIIKTWASDKEYVRDQSMDSSWSHDTEWGEAAANKFIMMADTLFKRGELFHNDVLADFGGNDGFTAFQFYRHYGIKPMVIDCEPERLAFARAEYGLSTLRCFIEDIPLPDNSIDWGFCSHMLEHTRDIDKALSEIARVVKRGCFFIVPMESKKEASQNAAHSVYCTSLRQWKGFLAPHWKIKNAVRTKTRCEAQMFATPREVTE